jgi:hypothetical protein
MAYAINMVVLVAFAINERHINGKKFIINGTFIVFNGAFVYLN